MPKRSKLERSVAASRVIAGLGKRLADKDSFTLRGVSWTPAKLAALFEAQLDAIRAVDQARAVLAGAVAKERKVSRQARELEVQLKAFVHALFGDSAAAYGDFGWSLPKTPGPKTPLAKLTGAVKARATRLARGTMGKRQRKKAERG
jgi:hypothetical protein